MVEDVVVKKFTFAISFPGEFHVLFVVALGRLSWPSIMLRDAAVDHLVYAKYSCNVVV